MPASAATSSTSDGTPSPGLWRFLREALGGEARHDFTEGALGRAILLLAIPMVLEMAMESIFAVVDVFFVSKLGADAVATVGLTESMLSLVYALAMGLSIGAMAVVARRIGEKDTERASKSAFQGIVLAIAIALPIGGAGVLLAPRALEAMGGSPWVIAHGSTYTRLMLGSMPVVMLLFLINAIFRAAGDAAVAMRVLWLANSINIVLGPLLVFGVGPFPRLGVTGAALATTIGRSIGVLFQLSLLLRGRSRVVIARRHIALELSTMWTMLRLSGSAIVQMLVNVTSWVVLVRIVSTFGSAAVAGYTIAIRLVLFALLPSWGMSNAAATLVGQNLGAKKPERAEQAVWRAGLYNAIFLGAVSVVFIAFAPAIIAIFTRDAEVGPIATLGLRVVSGGFVFYAYGMVVGQAFNGAGDTWTPTALNLLCFWILELPLAYVLSSRLGWGPTGVFSAIGVAFPLLALLGVLVFRTGRWKARQV